MDKDEKVNRSSAPSTEQLAESTAQSSAAVREAVQSAVAAVFQSLGPMLEKLALTPEKIQELKAPYIDPKRDARERREQANTREQITEQQKQEKWRRDHCQHLDKNGKDSISVVHNFPDHQPRGVCVLCHDMIHPREWRILAPDSVTGKTKSQLVDAHKDYSRVLHLESMNG